MRGRGKIWACAAIAAGVVILLALILPAEVWWFFFATGLICFGIWALRCR